MTALQAARVFLRCDRPSMDALRSSTLPAPELSYVTFHVIICLIAAQVGGLVVYLED